MSPTLGNLRSAFLLDPDIHFLNHGSFGACPIPVFRTYQEWQLRLERQPVAFLGREFSMNETLARSLLAEYLHTKPENLIFITNATHGLNILTRSLNLLPGDEILTTNHEYGACEFTWEFACNQSGAILRRHVLPLPVLSDEEMLECFWQSVTPKTKVIFISHITSPTAMQIPVQLICLRARQAGILTIIDGAHAPGQIQLYLDDSLADFYLGNCHKWMLAPKGVGFLYARPEVQSLVEPFIVSWGYHPTPQNSNGSKFLDNFQWTGTRDPAALLSVPASIRFMQEHKWPEIQSLCRQSLLETISRISNLTGISSVYPLVANHVSQMGISLLPKSVNTSQLKEYLYSKYQVEVPILEWNGEKVVRISIQAYNNQADCDALVEGLSGLL